jgi:hypothetical protein
MRIFVEERRGVELYFVMTVLQVVMNRGVRCFVGELDGSKSFTFLQIVKFEISSFSSIDLVFLKQVGVCVIPPSSLFCSCLELFMAFLCCC